MEKKLTLRMEESTIEAAKQYAASRGTSVSRLVESLFARLSEKPEKNGEHSALTRALAGTLPKTASETEYRSHLVEKHR